MTLDYDKELCLVILLLLFVSPLCTRFSTRVTASPNQTYYVAPSGDDANPGTLDQPWSTIHHSADTLVAGETVCIRNGVYREQVLTTRSGDPVDGYIVFSAYPGEKPVIDGTDVTTGNNGFIINHDYIKLVGLEICNWPDDGILMCAAGYTEVQDCEVHDVGGGIGAADGTHDFVFERVLAHHFTLYGFDASPSDGADCYNGVFSNCTAYTGRDPDQNVDGFALGHGKQHGFMLSRCVAYNVYDGFDMSAYNVTLSSCSAHDCWNTGYKLWADNITLVNCLSYHNDDTNMYLAWDGKPGTSTLRNCHFVDGGTFNVWVENPNDGLHMYNCILAGGDNLGLAFEQVGVTNYRGDYNVFHNDNAERVIGVGYQDEFSLSQIAAGDWATYSGQDQHSLVSYNASQLFNNLANWDLHLVEGSIAIDAGTSQDALLVDCDGVSRPQGKGYDIGAYEYSAEAPPATKISTTISCSTSLSEVAIDSSITVKGSIIPAVSGETVKLTYTKPDASTLNRTVTTAANGSYSDSYRADAVGPCSVSASWEGDSTHYGASSLSITFTVREKPFIETPLGLITLYGGIVAIMIVTVFIVLKKREKTR